MNDLADLEKPSIASENVEGYSRNWKRKCLDIFEKFTSKQEEAPTETSSDLLKKKEDLEAKLNLQLDEIKRIEKELCDIEGDRERDVIRYKLQLYKTIANITWDHHMDSTDVRGFISKPVQTFSLSTNTHSKYEIANHLWKLISEEENLESSPSS